MVYHIPTFDAELPTAEYHFHNDIHYGVSTIYALDLEDPHYTQENSAIRYHHLLARKFRSSFAPAIASIPGVPK